MASEIAVALTTGGLTLGGTIVGALGATFGPWVSWGVEKRRFERDSRVALIKQWRYDIKHLRGAEVGWLNRQKYLADKGEPPDPVPPEIDLMHFDALRRLRVKLQPSAWAVRYLNKLLQKPLEERVGEIPDFLEKQVLGIESKWGLSESSW